MVEVEQASHIEGSDQFSLKRVPTSRRTEEVACRGGLQGRNLSNLFCSGVKTWWAEDKLSNYRCCQGNVAVFSSPRCNNQEVGTWSGWSSWGECEKRLGPVGLSRGRGGSRWPSALPAPGNRWSRRWSKR